ncbi:16S rRNA methyltransferase [Marinibacterium profundimaris]|uniref:Ribosomal RNA small subunit methyltransferase G n=1 Tax=Marinibacterium profundimaris TaxID=1679460 RepID=A0A225NQT2_9RHOB|nr:16S rRNA (guanine(527)-N(7))-methyltransferase RsmG [Marinibacterium profundimaris]OWU76150.1 16S rRNA methyltransferase [Marinibacterium profundimaris]
MGEGPGAVALNVSRETYERLQIFADLLVKWNPKINLVSRASLPHLWSRHIVDSLQVYRAAPRTDHWADLGSGGGFPGVIAAILAAEPASDTRVTLIESDQRKAVFLRTAARECGVSINVLAQRIESAPPQSAGVVSARALADLTTLLGYATRHAAPDGTMLFLKGKTWGKEVEDARATWQFDCDAVKSETEPEAVLLVIKGVSRD